MSIKPLFPTMMDRPEGRTVVSSVSYGILAFTLVPICIRLLNLATANNPEWDKWIEIGYHLLNFIAVLSIFYSYLAESFVNVRIYFKNFIVTTVICLILTLVYTVAVFIWGHNSQFNLAEFAVFGVVPVFEMDLLFLSSALISYSPILAAVCAIICAPVSTCCLFYAAGFAPAANKKPWIGYLVVTLVLLLPRLLNVINAWILSEEIVLYLVQLPIHLLACWSYQKTDTVWAPIAVLTITNLLASLMYLFLLGFI